MFSLLMATAILESSFVKSAPHRMFAASMVLRGAIIVFAAGAPAAAQATIAAAVDSSWYVPPNGCTGNAAAIRLPADSLRMQSGWSDTSRDRNAHDGALARGVPGGWGGVWVDGSGLAIALADTSRRIEAVHALYARGYRTDRETRLGLTARRRGRARPSGFLILGVPGLWLPELDLVSVRVHDPRELPVLVRLGS